MPHILLLGCGYVGSRFAQICRRNGHKVSIITRSANRIESLEIADEIVELDWCCEDANFVLPTVDIVVCCVSHRPGEPSQPQQNDHAFGLSNILQALKAPPQRLVYLSTTGVYADPADGEWVNEDSQLDPSRPGTVNACRAEAWLRERLPDQAIVLRPAGIYGPDRIPNLLALKKGDAIAARPNTYLNLTHVDDLAEYIHQVAVRPSLNHHVYNVADGNPVLRKEYYDFICALITAPPPKFFEGANEQNGLPRQARSQGNKRIDVSRLLNEKLMNPRYPNYQIGLSTILSLRDMSL
jgi:nucleoside-diphosphate-sugar epimerase